jgi:protein SCO1/2
MRVSTRLLAAALALSLLPSAVRAAGPDDRRTAARSILEELQSFDGATSGPTIAARLERLAELGPPAAPLAAALVPLIEDRSPLFAGRDEHDVIRLRSLALAALARIGPPPESALLIAEQLDESFDPRAIAAAARAFSRLPGKKSWGLRALLNAYRSEMMDEPLCLDRYSARDVPVEQETTMRLEVLRALRSLKGDAREALPLIGETAKSNTAPGSLQERLRREAEEAMRAIADAAVDNEPDTSDRCAACEADAPSLAASRWRAPTERDASIPPGTALTAQDGRAYTWRDLTDHPSVVTFFYTRCRNPNRCDRTMARVSALRRQLQKERVSSTVRILCVTMEPARDTPAVLLGYAQDRQLPVDGNLLLLRPDPSAPRSLIDQLEVPVGLCGDQVSTHGVALYVLDSGGRVARTYRSLLWDPADIIRDLKRLCAESQNSRPNR